jgi:hypothetical protein
MRADIGSRLFCDSVGSRAEDKQLCCSLRVECALPHAACGWVKCVELCDKCMLWVFVGFCVT